MNDITITGHLVYAPTLRIGTNDAAYTYLRVAHTPRYRNYAGEWTDGSPVFLDVSCRKGLARNVCDSLGKGSAVIVTGELRMKEREVEVDGRREIRTIYEIAASAIGPDLNRGATQAVHTKRESVERQERAALAEAEALIDPMVVDPFAPSPDFVEPSAA